MKALVLGGTGLISVGIVNQLLARGADVTVFNRGQTSLSLPSDVRRVPGDRHDVDAFERALSGERFDVVIDMICYTPADAQASVRVFAERCEHFIFCSTVCTYGSDVPRSVLIDETFPQRPITPYARDKLACEHIFAQAALEQRFALTILRPSHTYGPGAPLIDQLEFAGVAWDRIARGQPVLCAGDGLGLWQPTHRDDCAVLFAQAALARQTYGQAYNATGEDVFTWREYYRRVARALDTQARLVFAPAAWLMRKLPGRCDLLAEITRHHGAYTSEKARCHVPAFRPAIDFESGARETLEDARRRGALKDSRDDHAYQQAVDEALALGFECVEA